MKTRKKTPSATETDVLMRSRRRCCICFGLHRDVEVKLGQIAHLDGDKSNSSVDNLAFLCLEHHNQYNSTTSQSKNLTLSEVKRYREELYERVLPAIDAQAARPVQISIPPSKSDRMPYDVHRIQELKNIAMEVLFDIPGPVRSINHLAHRLSLAKATVEQILFELAKEGRVRIDRSRGSTRKTYSLATAPENRLIDTFISQVDTKVVSDDRFVHSKNHELDAIIRTDTGRIYAVDTMCAWNYLSRAGVATRIQRISAAKREIGVPDAIGVLLIGITTRTRRSKEDLKSFEEPDLLIRYVELE